jgi:hypothetical protein
MAYAERSSIITRREFVVSVDPSHGAAHSAVNDAWRKADRSYREAQQLAANEPLPDNAIAFWPGADEIVISYETEAAPVMQVDDVARLLGAYEHVTGRTSMPFDHLPPAQKQELHATARAVLDFLRPLTPAQPART